MHKYDIWCIWCKRSSNTVVAGLAIHSVCVFDGLPLVGVRAQNQVSRRIMRCRFSPLIGLPGARLGSVGWGVSLVWAFGESTR